jgi:hypothetical protein
MPLRLSLASVLAAAAAAGSACAVNFDSEGYIAREQKRFEAPRTVDLSLYTFDGSVEIRSWDRAEVLVEVEKRGPDEEAVSKIEVLAERDGDRIQVEARRPGGRTSFSGIGRFVSPSARLIASVPRLTNVIVRTGDGAIVARRLEGRVELRTTDGSIHVVESTGDLLVESGDGTLRLEDVTGRVEARTDDGSVRVSGTPTALRVRSGDGSISVRIRRGAVMSEDWMITTADGGVSVELPDDFSADIEADPGSDSRVRNELTLVNASGGTRDGRVLTGTLGTGGRRFTIRTGDGTVRLLKY